ncbi:PAS domain S-box protein [Caproiciproducens sp. NJN-50]|uniref:PrpR N-terminal domain-containing protein n=1 Tax=Acutalibacteraceae TaxID=3082771 RepID=UPI000FFE0374|nr:MULTISPECIES: PrpR N-terminal domain-containing protein [Acutalibacteraceae]QAT50626.1 PAS domain S-box protein [Caproiciproducens sp. NJN-50]
MSGIALFAPDDETCHQAEDFLKTAKDSHISIFKRSQTEDILVEAQKAISEGVTIIIARGRQAEIIKKNTNVTVADIVLTAQELGLLILKAKNIIGINKRRICIGLFGWGEMFCDTTYFEQLYDVTLRRYPLHEEEEWRNVIRNSVNDGIDIIIGGKSVMEYAEAIDIPSLYLSGTGESLRVAIKNAESLYHMAKIEERNYAQFSTVLDSSSNGIIKLSSNGKILILNRMMEEIIGIGSDKLIGLPINRIFKEINQEKILEVLNGETENYSTLLTFRNQELVLIMEPIIVDQAIEGGILSFNRLHRINAANKNQLEKQYLSGYVAHATFDDISKKMKGLYKIVETAKLYALSSSPMLIESLSGPELDVIAQGIHNYSMRRNGPFLMINMAGMTEDQQSAALFGTPGSQDGGALLDADHGTLVIQSIDKLSLPIQYKLTRAIRSKRISTGKRPSDFTIFDTRIIACTAKDLTELRKKYLFRSDLYFTLKSLCLRIPELKDRPEDVAFLLSTYTRQYMQQYSRFHVLTGQARKLLLEYPWEGNSIQLQTFCERMILTAQSRSITEEYVLSLLNELYHNDLNIYEDMASEKLKNAEFLDKLEDPMYKLIYGALQKYKGNRKLAAAELKISTTTLWRKMKKYQMTQDWQK